MAVEIGRKLADAQPESGDGDTDERSHNCTIEPDVLEVMANFIFQLRDQFLVFQTIH